MTVLALPDDTFRAYMIGWNKQQAEGAKCCSVEMDVWTVLTTDPSSYKNWSSPERLLGNFPWSLTAALTPGSHHVRLYLETEGKIQTMISEKDNFVKFHSESSPSFLSTDGSRLTDLRPRDPNITVNDLGVYVMTWDNRPATEDYAPGGKKDATAVARNFGLAFSVDGLNWTVVSNELYPEGLNATIDLGKVPNDQSGISCLVSRGGIRHVVPVFLTNDQIRIYFTTSESRGTICKGSPGASSCSTATAVSN